MRRLLLASLLAFGCAGQADLVSGDIEGFNASDIRFAIFGSAEGFGFDLNQNGSKDATGVVKVILSDRDDLCEQLQNPEIIDNFNRLGDATLVSMTGVLIEDGSEGPVIAGNDLNFQELVTGGEMRVEFRVIREGNTATTANNVFENVRNGSMNMNGATGNRATGNLAAEVFFFDDAAGEDRSTTLNGFFQARRCFALDALAVGEDL
jgi:hypothetical protein